MLLHEYRPNVEYRFVCQSGPIHRPMFTMCVDINEHKFEGFFLLNELSEIDHLKNVFILILRNW